MDCPGREKQDVVSDVISLYDHVWKQVPWTANMDGSNRFNSLVKSPAALRAGSLVSASAEIRGNPKAMPLCFDLFM